MQTQLEFIKSSTNKTLSDLINRNLTYIPFLDYEGFVKEYKKSGQTLIHNILSSFLEFKKEQNYSFMIISYYTI